jgi:ribose transport system substrate-binding protein
MFWLGLTMAVASVVFWLKQSKYYHHYHLTMITAGTSPYWNKVMEGARDAAKAEGVELTIYQPKDVKDQSDQIRQQTHSDIDGMAVSPLNAVTELNDLDNAAAVIPLVTLDTDCPLANRVCFVGSNNYDAGRSCADLVKQALPDGGSIVICLGTLEKDSAQRRRQGLIDGLLDRSIEPSRPTDAMDAELKGDKYTVIATLLDGFDPSRATEMAVDEIQKHPDVKCFVGLLAYSTPALIKAMQQANKLDQVQIVGFDCDEQTLAGIAAKHVFGTIRQHQYECGYESIRILSEAVKGNRATGVPIFPAVYLPIDIVTKETLDAEALKQAQ